MFHVSLVVGQNFAHQLVGEKNLATRSENTMILGFTWWFDQHFFHVLNYCLPVG